MFIFKIQIVVCLENRILKTTASIMLRFIFYLTQYLILNEVLPACDGDQSLLARSEPWLEKAGRELNLNSIFCLVLRILSVKILGIEICA